MNGLPASKTAPAEVYYPSSDGEPVAETEAHLLALIALIDVLRQHFRGRPDLYVIGDMFWYYEEGNPLARKAPDVMVVKGGDPAPPEGRRSFKSWEEKANPCFILELTSEKTADEDTHGKFELYERLGVREYFLFDPLRDFLERPLVGYRLIGGRYEPLVPAADGSLPSNELGLRLVPEGPVLRLIDMRTGQRLVDLSETLGQRDALRRELELAHQEIDEQRRAEEQARQEAERRVEAERRRAADLERRLAELQAELARLKSQAPPPAAPGPEAAPS